MKIQEILQHAKDNNALALTGIDRYDLRFESYESDNSYNRYDINIYTFMIQQKDNLTFCFIPNNDNGDLRGLNYEDNVILFTDLNDYYNFIGDITEQDEIDE